MKPSHRRSLFITTLLSGMAVLAACSSSTTVTPGQDASTPENDAEVAQDTSLQDVNVTPDTSTKTDAGKCVAELDGGAGCNTLTNVGTNVPLVATGTTIPTGTGGPISDGHYVLTDFKSYTGSLFQPGPGAVLRQTLDICGTVGQLVGDDGGKPTYHKTFTLTPSGVMPNDTEVCTTQAPSFDLESDSYTATATTYTTYSTKYFVSATYTIK